MLRFRWTQQHCEKMRGNCSREKERRAHDRRTLHKHAAAAFAALCKSPHLGGTLIIETTTRVGEKEGLKKDRERTTMQKYTERKETSNRRTLRKLRQDHSGQALEKLD